MANITQAGSMLRGVDDNTMEHGRITVSDQAIADEIRIIQSVQVRNYMPVLLFGNTYPAVALSYITWPVPLDSGAI